MSIPGGSHTHGCVPASFREPGEFLCYLCLV